MTPERRREMIVRTALPLVAEHGTAVTTGQIARAAGIGEATVFRVFADKDELLDACVAEALRTDHVLAEIEAVPLDQPLRDRLAEAFSAIEAYLARIGTVLGALHATGRGQAPRPRSHGPPGESGRDAAMSRTRDALAALLEPDRDRLRLPAQQVAGLFMGLAFTRARPPAGPGTQGPSLEEYLDVFLHGALKEGNPE
ncbi:TetR/AcrR family transcriptional regulator [Actinomadura graeca]|uniref:TetR/AcrR family transcriptional regulator n=2 Tax=Actinomadura graeca TaxID=2750812 RepID=A0ABX8R7A2_9ACTN|nr:TetR/AcrR family transcriptional regulator [Actinomadura graeca]